MMSATHISYARQIEEHIKLKYGVSLKHYSFIYGSVKPDVSILFGTKYPHYFDVSLDGVCHSASILLEAVDSKSVMETRAFSRELGVIMHYVTDFFCRVHNDINGVKHSESFGHVVYEQKFENRLKIYELDRMREVNLIRQETSIEKIEETSLKEFLIMKHNKYLREAGKLFMYNNGEKKRMLDLKYSFGISLDVASFIIEKALKNIEEKGNWDE